MRATGPSRDSAYREVGAAARVDRAAALFTASSPCSPRGGADSRRLLWILGFPASHDARESKVATGIRPHHLDPLRQIRREVL